MSRLADGKSVKRRLWKETYSALSDRGQFVEQVVARVCGISGDLFGSLPRSAVMRLFD